MTDATGLSRDEVSLLKYLHAKLGRRMKAMIRDAWESGIYPAELVYRENDEQTLQRLRNTRGPSWLSSLRVAKL